MQSNFINIVNRYDDSNFKNQLDTLSSFVTDNEWLNMLKYDIALNPDLAEELTNIINYIDVHNFRSEDYKNLIEKLRKKCVDLIEDAKLCDDTILKWYKFRHAYAYYGFIETITEGSVITQHILDNFKKKYKDNYLEVLKKIDNYVPSTLTNFKSSTDNDIDLNDEDIKIYLTMKYYQDDQHIFHEEKLISLHQEARKNFEKIIRKDYPHLNKVNGKSLLMLYILDNVPIININMLSRFIMIGEDKNLSNIIGGKNIGLSKLNTYGCLIPETYAIPVTSLKNRLYEKELYDLKNQKYAVRSSATVEDNENNSFAGLFTSILASSKEDLKDNIKIVYDSLYNPRVNKYVEYFNTDKPFMSVVLQKYKEPTISGVWIGNDINDGYLEWIYGNGEKLVSGHVKPNSEKYPNNSEESLKIDEKKVGEYFIDFQRKINQSADLEWCILDDKLVWLQYRPVTKKIECQSENIDDTDTYVGVAASSGLVVGKPIYLSDPEDVNDFIDGCILLTDFTDPDWVPIILKSSAIVTAEGGFLSHTAIISRELGIPCVTGVGYDVLDELKNENQIQVNGDNGSVKKYTLNNVVSHKL